MFKQFLVQVSCLYGYNILGTGYSSIYVRYSSADRVNQTIHELLTSNFIYFLHNYNKGIFVVKIIQVFVHFIIKIDICSSRNVTLGDLQFYRIR